MIEYEKISILNLDRVTQYFAFEIEHGEEEPKAKRMKLTDLTSSSCSDLLCPEILEYIFTFLSKKDLLQCASLVCHQWKDIVYGMANIWRRLEIQDVPFKSPFRNPTTQNDIADQMFAAPYFREHLQEIELTPMEIDGMAFVFESIGVTQQVIISIGQNCSKLQRITAHMSLNQLHKDTIFALIHGCPQLKQISLNRTSSGATRGQEGLIDCLNLATEELSQLEWLDLPIYREPPSDDFDYELIERFFKKFGSSLKRISLGNFYDGSHHESLMIEKYCPKIEAFSTSNFLYCPNFANTNPNMITLDINTPFLKEDLFPLEVCRNLKYISCILPKEQTDTWIQYFMKHLEIKLEGLKLLHFPPSLIQYLPSIAPTLQFLSVLYGDEIDEQALLQCTNLRRIRIANGSWNQLRYLKELPQLDSLFFDPFDAPQFELVEAFLAKRGPFLKELWYIPFDGEAELISKYCPQLIQRDNCVWRSRHLYKQ